MWKKIFSLIFVLIASSTLIAFSITPTEQEVLDRLFTHGPAYVQYTKQFELAVPQSTMEQILTQFTQQLGIYVKVEGMGTPYTVVFEGGRVTTYITLDSQGKIAGLQFTEIISNDGTLADAVNQIIKLDGKTSVLIRKNGEVLVAHNADTPLAVGSAFKLGVLAAVDDAVKVGTLQWDHSVPFDPSWKSLPTGILQDWPSGTYVTIETLAALMISLSDNSAADALISIVGRDNVETYMPHSIPALTTGEMFRLKNPINQDILTEYRSSSISGKREILNKLANRELPQPSLFSGNPIDIDIEWFLSTTELANLIERLEVLPLTTINPGLAIKEHWRHIAYKGGSEPGVLNLTTHLIDADSNRYTVSVTVNNAIKPLEEKEIMGIYQTILNHL